VCQALKKAMMRLEVPEDKIVVVPNGVDHKKFHPIPKQTARRKLGLPLNHRILLSVGGLVPRKGFDVVIKALKIAIEDFGRNDLFLVIVGEGSQRTQLENLIELSGLEDRVLLVGTIPHEELYVWYSAADLFCLASSREGWPNVLLESLACGTPVVATEVWGIPEIIRREDIGLLSEREPAIMASRIREAIQKDWDGEAIRRYAATFTWSATAARVHEVFNLVLSNRESCD
jgi:glycosyltransferase involved in cell wall biosynthesis